MTDKLEQLWMRKFWCLLFVLKRSYICYHIICMTVPSNKEKFEKGVFQGLFERLPYLNPFMRDRYHIETSPLTQWTGFYIITAPRHERVKLFNPYLWFFIADCGNSFNLSVTSYEFITTSSFLKSFEDILTIP